MSQLALEQNRPREILITSPADAPTMPIRAPAPMSEAAHLLQIIDRAARDPAVDVDKFRQLMEMRKEAEDQVAKRAFYAAMAEAQSQMRPVVADQDNPQTRSKFASYAALDAAIRPIYTGCGFGLSFDTGESPLEQHIRVLCDVFHDDGYCRQYHVDMPSDGKGAKGGDVMTKTHAAGSAMSYGKRYLLTMIFNIAVKKDGSDDDGNAAGAASAGPTISTDQIVQLKEMIESYGFIMEKVLSTLKIAKLSDLPASRFQATVAAFNNAAGRSK